MSEVGLVKLHGESQKTSGSCCWAPVLGTGAKVAQTDFRETELHLQCLDF